MRSTLIIRTGEPDEVGTIFAIDEDACRRYETAGAVMDLKADHPFVLAERGRWRASLLSGDVFLAEHTVRGPVGIAVMGWMDGEPYLDQLSVRLEHAGRGIGSTLLEAAVGWARRRAPRIWLNTYGHLSWNRPFYERRGFVLVDEPSWNPEMRATVETQRASLPWPDQRVVMARELR